MSWKHKAEKSLDIFIAFCVVAAATIFVIELFFHPQETTLHTLHRLDAWLIGIFVADLGYTFVRVFDKRKFIRKNWLLILSFLPIVRMAKMMELGRCLEVFRLYKHRHQLANLEHMGIKGIEKSTHKLDQVVGQVKKKVLPDWRVIKGTHVTLYTFISDAADKTVAAGILRGMKHFLKARANTKAHELHRDFYKIYRKEQALMPRGAIDAEELMDAAIGDLHFHGMNVVITDEEIDFTRSITEMSAFRRIDNGSSAYIFSTHGLQFQSDKYPLSLKEQKELRGFIIGYHTMVKRFEYNFLKRTCTHAHCLHGHVAKKDLDLHSFLYQVNRRLPLCECHGG